MQQQRHGVGVACGGIAYHSGTDFGGVLLPQEYCVDDLRGFDFDFDHPSDMVVAADPYSCNGVGGGDASVGVGAVDGYGKGDENRKRRRLASNRESARRARVRKQRRLDELSLRAARLAEANHKLLVELNRVVAEHGRVARESARLREEARQLQGKLDAMELEEEAGAGAGAEEDDAAATLPPRTPQVA